jgi:predicted dehydrogenase
MRIGILGFGKIAREALYPAILKAGYRVTAIGSARGVKPNGFQGKVFTDYSEVITSGLIDAVYIALPNHLHVPISQRAIEAGIPVLCEKPLGLSAAEVNSLSVVAEKHRSFLMEAFMVAHHPQWQWIRQQIPTEEPLHLSVQFHYDNRDPLNIRNRAETGGGARLDIGCYALWVAHWLGARSLKGATGCQWVEQGVDARTSGSLIFDEHLELHLDVSMRRARFQQVIIHSQKHCWVIPRPFNPSANTTIWTMGSEGICSEHKFEAMQYERMIEAFSASVHQKVKTDLSVSQRIANWSDTIKYQFEERIVE